MQHTWNWRILQKLEDLKQPMPSASLQYKKNNTYLSVSSFTSLRVSCRFHSNWKTSLHCWLSITLLRVLPGIQYMSTFYRILAKLYSVCIQIHQKRSLILGGMESKEAHIHCQHQLKLWILNVASILLPRCQIQKMISLFLG